MHLQVELKKDNGFKTLYSNTDIHKEELFSKKFDIEHIIPQARLFDDSFSNKTLEARSVNIEKSNDTALDYIAGKYGQDGLAEYKSRVMSLCDNGAISKTKCRKLLMSQAEIPTDFINRELRDSQYIAKKAREILESLVKFVVPTTGSITKRLREDWQLVDVMKELNWSKYEKLGLTEIKEDKDGRRIGEIKDWTKRNDHRHHAMDALTIAFTKRSYVQYLNNLNARSDKAGSIYGIEQKELERDERGKLRFRSPIMPISEFRHEALQQLDNTIISIKAKNKVVTKNINTTKRRGGCNRFEQLTPRGQLHNETIYGRIKQYVTKLEKVGSAFDSDMITRVANQKYRDALAQRLQQYDYDVKKAFTGKNSLSKNPLYLNEAHSWCVPEKVKVVAFEDVYTIRKPLSKDLKIEKVVDAKIRNILQSRLDEAGGDAAKAFGNLEDNPIWQNEENGILIKNVTISGVSNAMAIHDKRDQRGKLIVSDNGTKQPADYVSTSNNHHVAIYRDDSGCLHEEVVSFFEATTRANLGLSIVDKDYNQSFGWEFLFTMKQNELFVFPNPATDFNPKEIDLLDPKNYALISPNLFRVQKLATMCYVFRHHLETVVDDKKELRDITWKRIQSLSNDALLSMVKVRVNHIGHIVSIGEY